MSNYRNKYKYININPCKNLRINTKIRWNRIMGRHIETGMDILAEVFKKQLNIFVSRMTG